MAFLVYANNPVGSLMLCRDKDRLPGYAIHIHTSTRLQIVQVNETIFGDQKDDTVLSGHLHGYGEVIGGFRREIDINCLLRERWIWCGVVNLHNMKLHNGSSADIGFLECASRTLAPVAVRTANVNSFVMDW